MSKSPLLWKLLFIVAVVGIAAWSAFPPEEKINLGLDLQGGAHILMQVDAGEAVKFVTNNVVTRLGQGLKDKNFAYDSILPVSEGAIEIRGTDPALGREVRAQLDTQIGVWSIHDLSGGDWRIEMPVDRQAQIRVEAVGTTIEAIRRRIDAIGVSEPSIQEQGLHGDRILVQLPGVTDVSKIKGIITDPALLEWKAVSYPPAITERSVMSAWGPPDSEEVLLAMFGGAMPDDTAIFLEKVTDPRDGVTRTYYWPLKRVSTVAGTDLRSAFRDVDEFNQPAVSFELEQDAGKRFLVATRENLGLKMAIVLNDEVISAPVINGEIRDRGIIQGSFTADEAEQLAVKLRSGAFPTKVKIIEERTIGPSLGHDSIRAGLISGLAGFLGVMLFMLVYYRLAGVNAVIALAMNILLIFGVLGALPFLFSGAQATLTLPGIAGLILTVGMAVDSNVLIFERIREELGVGKTIRSAVDQGFGKAFSTILDCNVTTLVAAFFLFSYGTGPVKGFAVTLTIGLLASMFTAVFVSRQIFELVLATKGKADTLSI